MDPVDFGKPFFDGLRQYDLVIVCNLKQEQPRIIFDAFSQGIGVVAADTSGILEITNPSNAILFKVGDAVSLAEAVAALVKEPHLVVNLGLAALKHVRGKTHKNMHSERKEFLEEVLHLNRDSSCLPS